MQTGIIGHGQWPPQRGRQWPHGDPTITAFGHHGNGPVRATPGGLRTPPVIRHLRVRRGHRSRSGGTKTLGPPLTRPQGFPSRGGHIAHDGREIGRGGPHDSRGPHT